MTIEPKITKSGAISLKLNGQREYKRVVIAVAARAIDTHSEAVIILSPNGDVFTVSKDFDPVQYQNNYIFTSDKGDVLEYNDNATSYCRVRTIDVVEKAIKDIANIVEVREVRARIEADKLERKIAEESINLQDKIERDAKASDEDNAFDLLPALDELNDVDEAEIEDAATKEETQMTIDSTVTVNDGYTVDSAKVTLAEAIDIINRLNYRNNTFEYRFTTREDSADIKYRHFDAYRDNGEKDSFAITEVVINGKLEIVRFYNLFRDIIVDLQIGNVKYTLGYKNAIALIDDEPEASVNDEPTGIPSFESTPPTDNVIKDALNTLLLDEGWKNLQAAQADEDAVKAARQADYDRISNIEYLAFSLQCGIADLTRSLAEPAFKSTADASMIELAAEWNAQLNQLQTELHALKVEHPVIFAAYEPRRKQAESRFTPINADDSLTIPPP